MTSTSKPGRIGADQEAGDDRQTAGEPATVPNADSIDRIIRRNRQRRREALARHLRERENAALIEKRTSIVGVDDAHCDDPITRLRLDLHELRSTRLRRKGRPEVRMAEKLADWALVESRRGTLDTESSGSVAVSVELASLEIATENEAKGKGRTADRRIARHHAEVEKVRREAQRARDAAEKDRLR